MQFDWRRLYLVPDGRIRRQDFWIAAAVLFVISLFVGIVVGWIPVVGTAFSLVLLYPWTCLASKRLHDFGASGWLCAVPVGLNVALGVLKLIVGVMVGGAAVLGGHAGAAAMGIMTGLGLLLVACVVGLIQLAFLLWVGLTPTQPGENQYGPEPMFEPAMPPPAA
jgi:uncharacterized membrane protein YhaH (DUF805 family)